MKHSKLSGARQNERHHPSLFREPQIADGALARSGLALGIEPFDATFRDNSRAPLHSWYPYLEGYSPKFVERVRAEFLPRASRILEPFAGSGTTPIVLGQHGVHCSYSELNPAMVFLIESKLHVMSMSNAERDRLAQDLLRIADTLGSTFSAFPPDPDLASSYEPTFGKSEFFRPEAFQHVLRFRTMQDMLRHDKPALAECFGIAVIASLVPMSLLTRAGDLRFKTSSELRRGLPDPLDLVSARLRRIARELPYIPVLRIRPQLACGNANALRETVGDGWHGVITSPPYLNGTNYVRNARLELWYLRQIRVRSDLRLLRDQMITSGINDVCATTLSDPVSSGVEQIVKALASSAYDARIPRMVGGYFADMFRVFTAIAACLDYNGIACVDIGDSVYAGVTVPTGDLLIEIATLAGFGLRERIHLRDRTSKGGSRVQQELLVLSRLPKASASNAHKQLVAHKSSVWHERWSSFKNSLPHQVSPFDRRDWGGPYHSMCSYQGKLKPSLAHFLVEVLTSPGDTIVDPFAGAGTIPFEACRMGRRGIGFDLSRLGYVLTQAKLKTPDPGKLDILLRNLEICLSTGEPEPHSEMRAREVDFNSAIPAYFHPETLREVLIAREFFLRHWNTGPEWAFALACTLHLLHGNRPYALSRRSHPVTPFRPTGEFEYRRIMPRLRQKIARTLLQPPSDDFHEGLAFQCDATATWPDFGSCADAVITSPPFFDSTRFYMSNWMRYWFSGWERVDFDVEPKAFLETRQKINLDVYREFFKAARERLREGAVLLMHLGLSPKCDMGLQLSTRAEPWFKVHDLFVESVRHCESHGVRDKGTVHGHSYLLLVAA